jgi:uncharacterized cupredoxin-like copper-binding protein
MTHQLYGGLRLLLAAVVLGALVSACSGGDDDSSPTTDPNEPNAYLEDADKDALFLIRMDNYLYTPSTFEVAAGDVIALAIQNDAPEGHDFTIARISADVHVSYIDGLGFHNHIESDEPAQLHFALTERGSGVIHIKVHEPGTYTFFCSIPGHREKGMEGTLVVN